MSNSHTCIDKEQIKSALDYRAFYERELNQQLPKLRSNGFTENVLCPFHSENTPSFGVNPSNGNFYCFGCGEKGDVFTFYMKRYGGDLNEACKGINDKYLNGSLSPMPEPAYQPPSPPEEPIKPIAEVWEGIPRQEKKEGLVFSLLQQRRGLKYSTVDKCLKEGHIKYAYMGSRDSVAVLFRKIDGTPYTIEYITTDKSNFEFYGKDSETDKMFRSGYRPKHDGFFFAGKPFKTAKQVILVESVINAMSVAETVPEVCVMALGSSDHTDKVKLLNPWQKEKKITCFMDYDEAGKKAVNAVVGCLDTQIYTVQWPGGTRDKYDANDLLKDGKQGEIKRMIEEAVNVGKTVEQAETNTEQEKQWKFSLPTPESARLKGRLTSKPEPKEYLINYGKDGLIPKGVIGVLTGTGGTGKSFFLMKLAEMAASGGSMGPINATRKIPTLFIAGEDPEEELNRRFWNIGKGNFPEDLYSVSVYGEIGPFMELDGNKPTIAEGYRWLEAAIQNFPGLELLIFDPKSRFYGLDENNNDHATQWIQCLETLSKKYGLTILFSHHTNKGSSGKIDQNMSRGASAIVDGCRWQGGIARMDEKTANKYGISEADRRNIIEFDVPKSNYSATLPGSLFFKRDSNGVPSFINLNNARINEMIPELKEILESDGEQYTLRELRQEKAGKHIADEMKERFDSFVRSKDMNHLVYEMIDGGILMERDVLSGKTSRKIIEVVRTD